MTSLHGWQDGRNLRCLGSVQTFLAAQLIGTKTFAPLSVASWKQKGIDTENIMTAEEMTQLAITQFTGS